MLETIRQAVPRDWLRDEWTTEVYDWGERVRLFRDYYEGIHRSRLTENMRNMLRISGGQYDQFNNNYCPLVVDTFADRLIVDKLTTADEVTDEWLDRLLTDNRFDALQMDIHEAAIRDGDTFALIEYDTEADKVRITHEPCWDGQTGMIVIYDRQLRNMLLAVKVWYEGSDDQRRVNFYYADRVVKYVADESGYGLTPLDDVAAGGGYRWLPGMVPVIHYRNKARTGDQFGVSELAAVIPLQDSLNRGLMSMVMTSELTAFSIRVARGFEPPAEITPGMWVTVAPEGLTRDQVADAFTLEAGGIVPFIEQANHVIEQIATITRTPLPTTLGGDTASGEALRQREVGLLTKVRRAQVRLGNAHEDLGKMAIRVYNAYGPTSLPTVNDIRCAWHDAEIRNDAQRINTIMTIRELVGDDEALRLLAGIIGYSTSDVARITEERMMTRRSEGTETDE